MAKVSLEPEQLDLLGVRAGDANEIGFTLKQNGQPMDLTNVTILAQARRKATDPSPVLTGGITMVDMVNGKFVLSWDGDEVREALSGALELVGEWDLQIVPVGSLGKTVVAGVFKARMDVART